MVVLAAAPALPADATSSAPPSATPAAVPGPSAGVLPPDESYVDLEIEVVEPAVPQPGDTLRLAGTVTNTGDESLANVNALLRHNASPLQSRSELTLLDEDPTLLWGIRPGSPFFEPLTEALAPGESIEFQLETTLDVFCPAPDNGADPCLALQFPGVYVTGVDIMATEPAGARVQAGTALTLLPWLVEPEQPVPVAMLWPLATTPTLLADGTLTSTGGSAFGPVGSARTLLKAPGDAPVTWIVDPDLLDTADAVASGDGPNAAAAASWLQELRTATAGRDSWLLPYAVPDLAAFEPDTAIGLAATSMRLTRSSADRLPGATPGLSWPASATASALTALDQAGATPVVLSGAVTDATGPWTAVQHDDSRFTALLTDPGLDATIRDATRSVDLRQRWLAETALAALDPGHDGRPLVTGPPPGWHPDLQLATGLIEAWTATPWVEPVALGAIDGEPSGTATIAGTADEAVEPDAAGDAENAGEAGDAGDVGDAGDAAGAPALPAETADAAAELRAAAEQYETLLAEPAGAEGYDRAAVRAASATWRLDPEAANSYAEQIIEDLRSRLDQVSLAVPPTVTLSSNTGAFPVNVVNELDVPVTVQLELASSNPDRMSVEQVTRRRIEAQETAIVQVTAEAVANGRVRVDMQLATTDGVPLGDAEYTVVNATNYGIIGWFLIAGAALLFAIGFAWRMLRGRRRNGTTRSHRVVRELDEVAR